ncbi:MAG: translation initiation factor eIF-1A [Candidatus Aenigmatarchaeota archaeon]|nr:MAG: translation initiation factor eIF-1A [Candidatus Aenigmarchaeota archaeon]
MEKKPVNPQEEIARIRMPRQGELLARVVEMSGASRMRADCEDGKSRMIRIPGKMRRRVWTRVNDIILVIPWEIEKDTKADLAWRYTEVQVEQLRKKGILKDM